MYDTFLIWSRFQRDNQPKMYTLLSEILIRISPPDFHHSLISDHYSGYNMHVSISSHKFRLLQLNIWIDNVYLGHQWCDSGPCGSLSCFMPGARSPPQPNPCWNRMVKRGEECSLLLKHSKGKVFNTRLCNAQQHPNLRPQCPLGCFCPLQPRGERGRLGAKKEVRKTAGIPPPLGGGERTAAQQTYGGARCCN